MTQKRVGARSYVRVGKPDVFDRQRQNAKTAAREAGDLSMKKHGRKRWNKDDYYAASREYNRLCPHYV